MTTSNDVFEWGFTGEDGEQFQRIHDASVMPEGGDDEIKEVRLGLEFNMFLTAKKGEVWVSGAITQEGENVLNTYGGLISLSKRMKGEEVGFKRIECGYSHALMISQEGKVYAFGAGLYG